MGVGNLTRRVGMNQSTREDRQTIGEAMGTKRPEKKERAQAVVSDVTEDVKALVAEFAAVEAQLKAVNEARAALKERAIELAEKHGFDDFVSPEGKVQVIQTKARVTFDKKKARQWLTEEQFESCHKTGKTPAPTVKFVAPKQGEGK